MDYDGRETIGMVAAGALGAGLGMLSYKHKKEIGVFLIKTASYIELFLTGKLKEWLNEDRSENAEVQD